MENLASFYSAINDPLVRALPLIFAFYAFLTIYRVNKKQVRENERFIRGIWDEISREGMSNEQAIVWLLVINTEKIERQAMYIRMIAAAALALLTFTAFSFIIELRSSNAL